jgi:hypothetical protein
MDPQTIRLSIELPDGATLQVSGAGTSGSAGGSDVSASSIAIDAGPPAPALLAALGDPKPVTVPGLAVDAATDGSSGDDIDAGSFPVGLALEMESEGPRHPMTTTAAGMPVTPMTPTYDRESRN